MITSRLTLLILLLLNGFLLARSQVATAQESFAYGPWRSSWLGGGGYIQNVVPTPDPQKYYAYVDVGGIYRSDDGGKTWRMLHGALPQEQGTNEVRGAVVDPRDANKIVIAAGSQWFAKGGIFVSSDAGVTWKKTLTANFYGNGGSRSAGFVLLRHPQNPDVLFCASPVDGVFRSDDNGATWKESGAKNLYPRDLDFDRANPQRMWLCAGGGKVGDKEFKAGFLRSDDGGATWNQLSEISPDEILQDPIEAGVLYGIFRAEVIKRSKDGGATWEDFSAGLKTEINPAKAKDSVSDTGYRALAAGPDFVLTASSRGDFYRLDKGATAWKKATREKVETIAYGTPWYHDSGTFGWALGSITVDPRDANHWFCTDFFSIFQSHDAGKNWQLTIDGIEVTVSHCLQQDPSDPAIMHLGQADVGPATSLEGGRRFQKNKVPDDPGAPSGGKNMKCIDLSPKLPNRLYGVADKRYYVGWLANQIYISIDRGQTWRRSPMIGLPNMGDRACTTIAADLNDPYTVYVTIAGQIAPNGGGIYKSTDGGARWTAMSDGLPEGKYYFPYDIWAHGRQLAVSSDGSLLAISQQGNMVHRFDTQAKKWLAVDFKHKGRLWSVVADRLKAGRYFIGSRSDGLYRSDDSGHTWKRVYDKSISYVATDGAVPGRVAGATLDGIVLSRDGGETWTELDKRLPSRIDNIPGFAGERIIVGSGGSGVFWMPLNEKGSADPDAKPLVIASVPAVDSPLPDIKNRSMNEGGATPAGWELWNPEGKLVLARDTQNFYIGPASLSLRSEGGAAYGTVAQEFAPTNGIFIISGTTKGKGQLKESLVALQVFDAAGKQIGWINLVQIQNHNKWWDKFSEQVILPAGAARVRLVVTLKGDGQVWLDEVAVSKPAPLFLQ